MNWRQDCAYFRSQGGFKGWSGGKDILESWWLLWGALHLLPERWSWWSEWTPWDGSEVLFRGLSVCGLMEKNSLRTTVMMHPCVFHVLLDMLGAALSCYSSMKRYHSSRELSSTAWLKRRLMFSLCSTPQLKSSMCSVQKCLLSIWKPGELNHCSKPTT